jgi:hypothetical protein
MVSPGVLARAEPVALDDPPPQVEADVVIEHDIRQAKRHPLENFRVVIHAGEHEFALVLEVGDERGGAPVLDDEGFRREGTISKGVVGVVVRVDEIENGLVGDFPHALQYLVGHLNADVGVDDQHPALADDEAGVVHTGNGRDQGVDARG